MSIAIAFLSKTGLVLGTDSRVTTRSNLGTTREDAYPKLVQFGRLPIAMAMVGAGAYGNMDFRSLVAKTHRAWCSSEKRASEVGDVAEQFAQVAGEVAQEDGAETPMTVLVAGYSPAAVFGEVWELSLPGGKVVPLAEQGKQTFCWRGQTEAVRTLWWGANRGALERAMAAEGIKHEVQHKVWHHITREAAWGPARINFGMPLRSAVDLIRFQLDLQIQYERFMPDRATCGAPIQLLAINEAGLHWVEKPLGCFADVGDQ